MRRRHHKTGANPCGEELASPQTKHKPQSSAPRTPTDSVHLCSRLAQYPTTPPPPQTPTLTFKRRSLVRLAKSQTTGMRRKKRSTREAADHQPVAQQTEESQDMCVLRQVYRGIGVRATCSISLLPIGN